MTWHCRQRVPCDLQTPNMGKPRVQATPEKPEDDQEDSSPVWRRFEGQVRKRVVERLESPSGIHGKTDRREGEHQSLSEEVQHMHGDGWRENGGGGIRSEVWEGTNGHVKFAKSKFPGTGNFRSVPSQQIPHHPSTPGAQ